MPTATRTPEEKAAWSAQMHAARAAKKALAAKPTPPPPTAPGTPEPPIAAPAPAPAAAAPPTVTRLRRHQPSAASPAPAVGVPAPAPPSPSSVPTLITALESLQLDSVSYADCGLLLNALSAFTTAVGLRRRQAQEQLDAGTHRAPCSTCGRLIDISKSGGYQILTERDEHYQPRNVYYCSQNCLLAKNLPSHARATREREKRT